MAALFSALRLGTASNLQRLYGSASATSRKFKRSASGIESLKIKVCGSEIYCEKVGNGAHKLLLMPGALGSVATDFQPQMARLDRDKFTVYAWDPPGYGKSIPPEREWPLEFFKRDADVAAELIKSTGDGPMSLAGWSDGGITALVLAVHYPELVNKLVVWGANAFFTDKDITAFEAIRDLEKWSARMREPMEQIYGKEYFKKHWNSWIDSASAILENNGGEIIANRVHEINCPTLVVHGIKDALVGEEHPRFLSQTIPGAQRVDLAEGKHNLHIRYHEWFNALMTDYLLHGTISQES